MLCSCHVCWCNALQPSAACTAHTCSTFFFLFTAPLQHEAAGNRTTTTSSSIESNIDQVRSISQLARHFRKPRQALDGRRCILHHVLLHLYAPTATRFQHCARKVL